MGAFDSPNRGRGLAGILLGVVVAALLCALSGCAYIPPYRYSHANLSAQYQQTQLRSNSTLDVLSALRRPEYGLDSNNVGVRIISQSDTAVARAAQSKDELRTWFTLYSFDERTMTARRKYFFLLDENATVTATDPKYYLMPPHQVLMFDCEVIVDGQLLARPYVTDEARQVEVLEQIAETLQSDVNALRQTSGPSDGNNKLLATGAMAMNQTFRAVRVALDESPGLAGQLSVSRGVAFEHPSLGEGRVRMTLIGDVAQVAIRVNCPIE